MRYKKIKFEEFSGGGQLFYSDPKKFYKSSNVYLDQETGKFRNANVFKVKSITGCNTDSLPMSDIQGNYVMLGVLGATVQVYRSSNLGDFSLKKTFASTDEPYFAVSSFDKYYIWYWDDSGSKIVCSYTSDAGTNWTTFDWDWDVPFTHTFIDDELFILTESGEIVNTNDGTTFALWLENEKITDLKEFGGILHCVIKERSQFSCLSKIYSDKSIERIRGFSHSSSYLYILPLDTDNLIIAQTLDGVIKLYNYNFEGVSLIAKLDDQDFSGVKLYFSDDNQLFLAGEVLDTWGQYRYIYIITKNLGVYHVHSLAQHFSLEHVFMYKNVYYFQVCDVENNDTKMMYVDFESLIDFESTCEIETSILELDGVVPIAFTIRCAPLPAESKVEIFVKENRASSWGNYIVKIDTTNAVKKLYRFPKGKNLEFIQFKIINYVDSVDQESVPRDVTLEFLYKPIGLNVAK